MWSFYLKVAVRVQSDSGNSDFQTDWKINNIKKNSRPWEHRLKLHLQLQGLSSGELGGKGENDRKMLVVSYNRERDELTGK